MRPGSNKRVILRPHGKTSIVVATALLLSACTTGFGSEPLTPAQAQLKQANDHFATTVAEGAIVGALLGAALGAALGGGRGAAIGAGAGLAAGTLTGYAVAQKNFQQTRTEANLQSLIQQANSDADAYERSAAASAQIASDLRMQSATLAAQYNSHAITLAQYQGRIANYRASADIEQKQLASMDAEVAQLRGDGSASLDPAVGRIDAARQHEAAALQDLQTELSAVPAG